MKSAARCGLVGALVLVAMGGGARAHGAPRGRYAHCAVVYKNTMLVHGGVAISSCSDSTRAFETRLADLWAFDLDRLEWAPMIKPAVECRSDAGHIDETITAADAAKAGPGQIAHHTCVVESEGDDYGSILVFGGDTGQMLGSTSSPSDQLWRLELAGGANGEPLVATNWQRLLPASAGAPAARSGHSAAVLRDGRMYIFGGISYTAETIVFGDLWAWSSTAETWTEIAPPAPAETGAAAWPSARCYHTGMAHPDGLLVFGGRQLDESEGTTAGGSMAWLSMQDLWIFSPGERAGAIATWTRLPDANLSAHTLLNCSSHAAVLRSSGRQLSVLGGLRMSPQARAFILRTFFTLDLYPNTTTSAPPPASLAAPVEREEEWYVNWVYEHSLVTGRVWGVEGVSIAYGGLGDSLLSPRVTVSHLEIFSDVVAYDHSNGAERWVALTSSPSSSSAITAFFSSLIFGTLGFFLCICVVVCVLLRRVARSRHFTEPVARASQQGNASSSGLRHRVSAAMVEALPKRSWTELACERGGAAARPAAEPAGSSRGSNATASNEGGSARESASGLDDACSICYETYLGSDMLTVLPCGHFFHGACISPWLLSNGSCPQCRFNLADATSRGSLRASRRSRSTSDAAALPDPPAVVPDESPPNAGAQQSEGSFEMADLRHV